ncbi:MAG: Inosine-5'-monophosphate dehydrogenase [Syntrophus sp. PtaB.Bin001]|nr:MAG: Inosine-5'-monophosphate dehydrogenase [Syntrophus sp. PtaB.Bin001]
MFVGRRMTRNLVTATEETSVLAARQLLLEKEIDQLPVLKGEKLVGIVTDRDIRQNMASPASTLSIHELNYLLSRMKVGEIMTQRVVTVSPDTPIEEAIRQINRNHFNSLPVVVHDNKLVGIITSCDLLNVLLEVMGVDLPSSRLEVVICNHTGDFSEITKIINQLGLTILSMFSYNSREGKGERTLVVRVNTTDVTPLKKELESAGYRITEESSSL